MLYLGKRLSRRSMRSHGELYHRLPYVNILWFDAKMTVLSLMVRICSQTHYGAKGTDTASLLLQRQGNSLTRTFSTGHLYVRDLVQPIAVEVFLRPGGTFLGLTPTPSLLESELLFFCHRRANTQTRRSLSIASAQSSHPNPPTHPSSNMPRQRGGAAPRRPTAAPARPAAPAPAPARHSSTAAAPPAQRAPTQQAAPAPQASQGPGLFGQMASTAA
jgi:hypothetical protein